MTLKFPPRSFVYAQDDTVGEQGGHGGTACGHYRFSHAPAALQWNDNGVRDDTGRLAPLLSHICFDDFSQNLLKKIDKGA